MWLSDDRPRMAYKPIITAVVVELLVLFFALVVVSQLTGWF